MSANDPAILRFIERICPNCKGELPCCPCQLDYLSAKAQAIVAHEQWRKGWSA
jgi:hypothetical protein